MTASLTEEIARIRQACPNVSDAVASRLSTRFWSKVDKSGECWLWTGRRDQDGYGRFDREAALALAHRTRYLLAYRARKAVAA